jgi:hypothetical protein
MYPHILDAIIAYAPVDSLLVLRQTCRAVRKNVLQIMFRHVIFIPSDDYVKKRVHVFMGTSPHIQLGSFRVVGVRAVRPDVDLLPGLAHTRVLDTHEKPWGWDRSSVPLPQLQVVRRVDDNSWEPRHLPRNKRYPSARTLVDYLDCTTILSAMSHYDLVTPRGTKHHIIHLAWTETGGSGPGATFSTRAPSEPEDRTLVLRPRRVQDSTSVGGMGGGATTRLRVLLAAWQPNTIIGTEGTHSKTREFIAERCQRNTIKLETYEAWTARFEVIESPAPEIMNAYHMSEELRCSRRAANRLRY